MNVIFFLPMAVGIFSLSPMRETRLFVTGPSTKAAPVIHEDGMTYLGIRFKVGTFMPHLPLATLVNAMTLLPRATSDSFWLGDLAWPDPDFNTAEMFVTALEGHGLLTRDHLVEAVLAGDEPTLSQRSIQRHFLKTTGLTRNSLRQIERARYAAALLQNGTSVADTVYKTGYTDQPHLTKALKHFIGQTPKKIAAGSVQH